MLEVVSDQLLAYQEDCLKAYQEINPTIVNNGIVFVGDSIIEFYPLKKFFGRDLPLHNRGIAGIDTYFLEKHLSDYLFHLEARQIFLLIGTNDLGLGHTISEIRSKVVDVVSELRGDNIYCDINLISVLPVSDLEQYSDTVKMRSNQVIDQLNAELESIPGINFINVASGLKNQQNALEKTYTKDGLHLNMKGYEKLSELLKPYLN